MPSLRPCLTKGCPNFVRGGTRCDQHGGWPIRPHMPNTWPRDRAAKLAMTPNCEQCGAKATTVDHVLARAFGGSERLSNLMSLCAHHAAMKDHRDREEGKRRAKLKRVQK